MPSGSRLRPPGLESLFVATFALLGLRLGLRPLGDNSLFVHLRTGIDLVRSGRIPRTDPYSFTAGGQPWVVQSWLAEASYGLAHRVGGFQAVRLEQGALYGLLAWLIARRARTASPARTALAAGLAIGLGVVYWSPRPLAFGLVALAATITIVEERRPPWLLLPVVWLWVNSHGSFVLGLAWLVAVAAGQVLDGRRRPPVLPWVVAFVGGLVVAMLNPLGPRLVAFPLTVLEKRQAFRQVVEWRSPQFQTVGGVLTLTCLVAVVVVIARAGKPAWADLVPVGGFLFLGLAAQRNLVMAAVVVAPVLGRALAVTPPPSVAPAGDPPAGAGVEVGPAGDGPRPPLHLGLAVALAVLALAFTVGSTAQPALALDGYPVEAMSLLAREGRLGRPTRLVTSDVAAGYLILLKGRQAGVFIDDRVDLYPVRTTLDYVRLLDGEPGALALLDHHRAEAVLWPSGRALAGQLATSPRWRRVGARGGWVVFVREERGGQGR